MGNEQFQSKNMNYMFNVEYLDFLCIKEGTAVEKNKEIENFKFPDISPVKNWETLKGFEKFSLVTCYPGLLIGTGNMHDVKKEAAIKCGFTFDYVTGLPYLPGSSLKGMLRSYFPGGHEQQKQEYAAFIYGLLQEIKEEESSEEERIVELEESGIAALETAIFEEGENKDVFLDAFPVIKGEKGNSLMKMEYITPHPNPLKNPIPISIVKIKPEVKFEFCFLLTDYVVDEKVVVNAAAKRELFKKLILEMGVGAKTNVGFGKFREI